MEYDEFRWDFGIDIDVVRSTFRLPASSDGSLDADLDRKDGRVG